MATQVQPSSGVVMGDGYLVITMTSMLDRGYYYCNLSSPLGMVTSPQVFLNVFSKSHQKQVMFLCFNPSHAWSMF